MARRPRTSTSSRCRRCGRPPKTSRRCSATSGTSCTTRPRRRGAPASRSRAATARASTASSSAHPTSTAPGAGSRPTTRSATDHHGRQRLRALGRGRHREAGREVPLPRRDGGAPPRARVALRLAVVVGDLNVGHRTLDIRNWKGNVKSAGFLPEERAYFDRFVGAEGDERLQPRRAASAGSTSAAGSPARSTAPTPGGRAAVRPSTTTPDGASTTSSPRRRSRDVAVSTDRPRRHLRRAMVRPLAGRRRLRPSDPRTQTPRDKQIRTA